MSVFSESNSVSRRMSRGWFQPSRDQKSVLMIGGILALLAYSQARWLGALPIVTVMLFLYAPEYGRKKGFRYSGIEAIFGSIERRRLRKRGNVEYSFDLQDTLLMYESAKFVEPPERKKSAFPVKLISVRPEGSREQFAFLRDKGGGEDHVVAILIFDGGPKFTDSSEAQRFIWDTTLVSALKRGVNTTLQTIELSMFVIARDADSTEAITYNESRWHEDFLSYEPGSVEEKLVQNAMEDGGNTYGNGNRFVCGVAIRMVFPKQWRRTALDELTLEQVTSTELMGVVQTIRNNLTGALTGLRLPSLFELNEVCYLLFNSEDLVPFYKQQREDIGLDMEGKLEKLEDALTLRRGPFPGHIGIFNDCAQVNKTLHTSVGVMEFEEAKFAPGFLDELFVQPFPFVYSHYVKTTPHKKGLKQTRMRVRTRDALSGFLHSQSSRELHLEDREAEEEAIEAHASLFRSKSRSTSGRIQLSVQGGVYETTQSHTQLAMGALSNHSALSLQLLGEVTQLPPLLAHLCLFDE